jgi:hypothetical protein
MPTVRLDCALIAEMKKPPNMFTVEVHLPQRPGRAFIGAELGFLLTISMNGGQQYSAPIEKVYATLQRWHAKANPTGKKRRRLFNDSEEYRKYKREHPEEFR